MARVLRGNHGLYGVIDQTIHRVAGSEDRGVAVFGRVIGSPDDRNLIELYVEGGLTFAGMLPSRPKDVFSVGIGHSRIAAGARGFDRDRSSTHSVIRPISLARQRA